MKKLLLLIPVLILLSSVVYGDYELIQDLFNNGTTINNNIWNWTNSTNISQSGGTLNVSGGGNHFYTLDVYDATSNNILMIVDFDSVEYHPGGSWYPILNKDFTRNGNDGYVWYDDGGWLNEVGSSYQTDPWGGSGTGGVLKMLFNGSHMTGWNSIGNTYYSDARASEYNVQYDFAIVGPTHGAMLLNNFTLCYDLDNDWECTLIPFNATVDTYSTPVIEDTSQTFNLVIDVPSDSGADVSATFNYNNTEYTTTKTSTSTQINLSATLTIPLISTDTNFTFYWNYTVNGGEYNSSFSNQSVYYIDMDNCTQYSSPFFLNFTIKNETDNSIVFGDIDAYFTWTYGTTTGNYGVSMVNRANFTFCWRPYFINPTTDITIQYSATGTNIRNYIRESYGVDNITEVISLFLLDVGESSSIACHVNDEVNDEVENAVIEAHLWNIDTNTYSVTETCVTNSEGECEMNLIRGTNYYKFLIYESGILQEETSRFIIGSATTDLYFRYDVSTTTALNIYLNLTGNIVRNITYDNDTKIVTFFWDDPVDVASDYCINITMWSNSNLIWVNDSCSTSNSGSLSYTITILNTTYYVTGIVKARTDSNWYTLVSKQINELQGWKQIGRYEGLMYFSLIVITLSFLGIAAPIVVIIMVIVSVIIAYFMQLLPITFGAITGLIIILIFAVIGIERRKR